MKMKGIIFNAEMVNAILDTGVLEYRKAISPQLTYIKKSNSDYFDCYNKGTGWNWWDIKGRVISNTIRCPFGKIGDRLFVKEGIWNNDGDWEYGADDKLVDCSLAFRERYCSYSHINAYHTKQEQSRLTVEITNIKVEKADVWEWVVNFKLIK